MAKSNKPIFWSLFAAGGTVTAFVTPALALVTLLAALGVNMGMFDYDSIHAFAGWWLGKLIIFGIILLSLWHAAHRLRVTVHDFGVRADTLVAYVVYGLAGLGTLMTIVYLLRI